MFLKQIRSFGDLVFMPTCGVGARDMFWGYTGVGSLCFACRSLTLAERPGRNNHIDEVAWKCGNQEGKYLKNQHKVRGDDPGTDISGVNMYTIKVSISH